MALLAAEPMLSAAFLRPEIARLFVVILAYVWLTLGLFWVGMPYLLRDQITWLTESANRFKAAAMAVCLLTLNIHVASRPVYWGALPRCFLGAVMNECARKRARCQPSASRG